MCFKFLLLSEDIFTVIVTLTRGTVQKLIVKDIKRICGSWSSYKILI